MKALEDVIFTDFNYSKRKTIDCDKRIERSKRERLVDRLELRVLKPPSVGQIQYSKLRGIITTHSFGDHARDGNVLSINLDPL